MKKLAVMLIAVCGLATAGNNASAQDFGGLFEYGMRAANQANVEVKNALEEAKALSSPNISWLETADVWADHGNQIARNMFYHGDTWSYAFASYWRTARNATDSSYRWLAAYAAYNRSTSRQLERALDAAAEAAEKLETAYQLALLYERYGIVYRYQP